MSYHRKQEEKRRLKKTYNQTKHAYGCGVYYDERKNRFIRHSCHNKWTKTHCRRMTRRRLNRQFNCYSGCLYKKFYDYWWKIL